MSSKALKIKRLQRIVTRPFSASEIILLTHFSHFFVLHFLVLQNKIFFCIKFLSSQLIHCSFSLIHYGFYLYVFFILSFIFLNKFYSILFHGLLFTYFCFEVFKLIPVFQLLTPNFLYFFIHTFEPTNKISLPC